MARHAEPIGPTLALAGLSAAAALALTRVFADGSWLAGVLAIAVTPHVLLWVSRSRGWSARLTLTVLIAGGVLAVVWIAFPHTTWHGVPTGDTAGRVADALRDTPETLRSARVPVPAAGTALFLAALATWLCASIAGWGASYAEATVAALVPSLVLYVIVSALGKGPWLWTAAVYAIPAGVFLAAQHEHLLSAHRSWFHTATARRSVAVAMGILATLGAVAAGTLLAPQLPGAGSDAWFDYRDLGDGGDGDGRLTIISPLVDIRSSLLEQDPSELFRVRATRPVYWRLIALEDFDGRIWGLSDDSEPANEVLGRLALPITTIDIEQEFRLTRLGGQLLPVAYAPVRITAGGARVLPDSQTIVRDTVEPGFTYRVTSQYPDPTPAELMAATRTEQPGVDELLALPDDFPDRVRELAAEITAGASTPYEQLLALQQWFRDPDNFTYSLSVPAGHSASDIERFLFETRAGYCEQFAGTFAAMARSLGFPARVAVGFQPGRLDPATGELVVTGVEAHAWPEVFLGGAGWTSFEPTPGRFDRSPNDHTGTGAEAGSAAPPPAEAPGATTPTTTAPGTGPGRSPSSLPRFPDGGEVTALAPDAKDGADRPAWRRAFDVLVLDEPWRAVLVVFAGVIGTAAAVAIATLVRKALRAHRRRHAAGTRARVRGAWAEASERLAEAGITADPALTPSEFALRRAAAQGAGAAGPPLVQLAHLVTEALYAPEPPSDADAERAWQYAASVDRALRHAAPIGTRVRRRLDTSVLRASPLDPARRS